MSKSQIRTLMCVLCLAALCTMIAGCEGQATCPKAKETKAATEKCDVKAKPAAEQAKPAAEKPKETAGVKAQTLGPYNVSSNWMDEQGFINNWLIVGPFPNPGERPNHPGFNIDYLKSYGGELNYVPTNNMEVKKDDGTVLKWQQCKSTTPEINFFSVDFLKLEPQQENILCYCACWIESDADKDVEMRIGSDDGYKLWLNHKLVSEQDVYRAMEMDQETHKVKLNKGLNLVLLKVTQDYGEFQFELRVVGSDGKAVPGVKFWN